MFPTTFAPTPAGIALPVSAAVVADGAAAVFAAAPIAAAVFAAASVAAFTGVRS